MAQRKEIELITKSGYLFIRHPDDQSRIEFARYIERLEQPLTNSARRINRKANTVKRRTMSKRRTLNFVFTFVLPVIGMLAIHRILLQIGGYGNV